LLVNKKGMETKLVDVGLTVEAKGDLLMAHLLFKNVSLKKIHLEKQTIYFNNEVRNTYFEIADSDGIEVDYTGMMAKRLILPEDFVEVNPGGIIKATIPLNEFYEVTKGNKYSIRYYAFNPGYMKEQELMEMVSNEVKVVY
jgi:hypothetical protein